MGMRRDTVHKSSGGGVSRHSWAVLAMALLALLPKEKFP